MRWIWGWSTTSSSVECSFAWFKHFKASPAFILSFGSFYQQDSITSLQLGNGSDVLSIWLGRSPHLCLRVASRALYWVPYYEKIPHRTTAPKAQNQSYTYLLSAVVNSTLANFRSFIKGHAKHSTSELYFIFAYSNICQLHLSIVCQLKTIILKVHYHWPMLWCNRINLGFWATSFPGRFSVVFLQSQGKAPWALGWFLWNCPSTRPLSQNYHLILT